VSVEPHDPATYVSRASCETAYTTDLIAAILGLKGIAYLCDEIARDEDPRYVSSFLRHALLGYLPEQAFHGKRVLDFGSGSGASTVVLGRMLPGAELVGVELREDLLEVARMRAGFYDFENMRFVISPSSDRLPADLGEFDFIVFSAVFEHLLPAERPTLLAQIWALLRPGGILFVNETPERWYPHESHTTGLPFLNYLPDRLAWRVGRRLSPRVASDASWEQMLRDGVRGGTEREVVRLCSRAGGGSPVSLTPTRLGCHDHVDLWYAQSMIGRPARVKRVMRTAFKMASLVGTDFTPGLQLAIQKRVQEGAERFRPSLDAAR
jgi:2-polyprenyl-3-methyl-5-hydroxy-6-metoxy-1,4-benzoquinol methylase